MVFATLVRRALDRGPPRTPAAPGSGAAQVEDEARDRDRRLRCRSCAAPITDLAERIEMSGAHAHTFVNPHGLVFRIGCFARADGCVAAGPSSAFFSWFPGYAWRPAACARCRTHLGWSFGEPAAFWGLVLDRVG